MDTMIYMWTFLCLCPQMHTELSVIVMAVSVCCNSLRDICS